MSRQEQYNSRCSDRGNRSSLHSRALEEEARFWATRRDLPSTRSGRMPMGSDCSLDDYRFTNLSPPRSSLRSDRLPPVRSSRWDNYADADYGSWSRSSIDSDFQPKPRPALISSRPGSLNHIRRNSRKRCGNLNSTSYLGTAYGSRC